MAGTSVIKATPSQDLLGDLRQFVVGATRGVKTNPLEFTRTALSLLKSLPAARDAVLEYFCMLFDVAVEKHVTDLDMQVRKNDNEELSPEEAAITEIHNVLCNFVSGNAEAWAPVISTWSLELLGTVSSRYSARAQVSSSSAMLKDSLQFWMSCRATRTLIDITTQCLSCLMHSDNNACINALLETSIRHSPNFDWVVAHVGSCFPQTVITKVLSCGLKDFCLIGSVERWAKTPKLNSVVGILSHLAGSHFSDVRTALHDLFKSSFESLSVEGRATVPFLLHLVSLSPVLLRALTAGILHTLTLSMLPQIAALAPDWCRAFGSPEVFKDLVVHLTLGCDQNAVYLVKFLLDAALPREEIPDYVRATVRDLIEMLLQEIERQLRSCATTNIPFLDSAKHDVGSLLPLTVSLGTLEVVVSVRLACLLARRSEGVLITCGSYMLLEASTGNHLAAFVRLSTGDYELAENGLKKILEEALHNISNNNNPAAAERLWNNVTTLLKWEQKGCAPTLHSHLVTDAMLDNVKEASSMLKNPPNTTVAHAIATALQLTLDRAKRSPSLDVMKDLTLASASYFFLCLSETNERRKFHGSYVCCKLLNRLAILSTAIRSLAIRELFESSLFREQAPLFGSKRVRRAPTKNLSHETSLLKENQKQVGSSVLAQRHSQVFHSGIIGNGPRLPPMVNAQPTETVTENTQLLIDAIRSICTNDSGVVSQEVVTAVSLMLVELVSPDVMYNGLPWPEEEFCKVTIERDLSIRRRMDELPLLWDLLEFVAYYRPALCYCSVLLRAITATLIAQWGASGDHKNHRTTTVRLLNLLALGQLLPPPLSALGEVIEDLSPKDVIRLLRECVWNYFRDNVPSPAMFGGASWRDPETSRPAEHYIEPFQNIILANISKYGGLYARLFVNTSPS